MGAWRASYAHTSGMRVSRWTVVGRGGAGGVLDAPGPERPLDKAVPRGPHSTQSRASAGGIAADAALGVPVAGSRSGMGDRSDKAVPVVVRVEPPSVLDARSTRIAVDAWAPRRSFTERALIDEAEEQLMEQRNPEVRTLLGRRAFVSGSLAVVGAAGMTVAGSAAPAMAATAGTTVEPAFGAGLFDVDPSQSGVSQSRHVSVSSNVSALPLDLAL